MHYWLLKTEPSTFGIDQLEGARGQRTRWDGVRNYQARNFIRDDIAIGDLAFLYHSSCPEPGIAGIVEVVRSAYPDPTEKPENKGESRWFAFDVKLRQRFPKLLTLATLRGFETTQLAGMLLLRTGNRLSITPVDTRHWRFILTIA